MFIIGTDSRFVNATVFALAQVVFWAIHRGLMALQGYSIYRRVSSGEQVNIARSRIPILSGDLLRGVGRLAYVFILINGAAIVLAIFGVLGINGQSHSNWIENYGTVNGYTRVTSLHSGRDASPSLRGRMLSCIERTESSVAIWPYAFRYLRGNRGMYRGECQTDAPGMKPVLLIKCVQKPGVSRTSQSNCELSDSLRFSISLKIKSKPRKKAFSDVREFDIIVDRTDYYAKLPGKKGRLLIVDGRNPIALIILYFGNRRSLFLVGDVDVLSEKFAEFNVRSLVRVKPGFLLRPKSLLSASLRSMSYSDIKKSNSLAVSVLKFAVAQKMRHVPVRFKVYHLNSGNVTIISLPSLFIMCFLLTSAVLLAFIKEMMQCIFRRDNSEQSELFMNNFDVISKMYRRRMEDNCGLEPTGEYSVLGTYRDKDETIRYGITVPLVTHRAQVRSSIDLCDDSICALCATTLDEPASSRPTSNLRKK